MKKILFTIAMTLVLTTGATAQNDGFFNNWSDFDNRENDDLELPTLPQHGLNGDQDAPLGSGMLILTALGAGYALSKRRD